jgi:sterol 3beta-glucosyltransferase
MFTPTGDYPNITLPDLKLRALNHFTHLTLHKTTWRTSFFGFEQVWRHAGLPKRKLYFSFDDDPLHLLTPILCAWSPSIIPPSNDWMSNVTGYYFFDVNNSCRPSIELQNFLDVGESPACISFRSMVNRDAKRIYSVVNEALMRTNNRDIILSGWSEDKRHISDNVLYLNAVPYDWLLPRCKMIVHHSGHGQHLSIYVQGFRMWLRYLQLINHFFVGEESPDNRCWTKTYSCKGSFCSKFNASNCWGGRSCYS